MENKNDHWYGIAIRFAFLFAALGGLSLSADAQISSATAQQLAQWWIVQGNTAQSVPAGTPGAISVPTAPSGTGPSAGGWTVEPVSNDWPDARAKSTPRGVPGGPVIDVKAKVKAAAVGAAIGRAAVKVVGVLAVGNAIYDLAKELDFLLDNSGGTLVVKKADPAVCTVAPCYKYRAAGLPYVSTRQAACEADAVAYNGSQPFYVVTFSSASTTGGAAGHGQCFFTRTTSGGASAGTVVHDLEALSVAPNPNPVYLPSNRQAFEDAIAAKSGWPTSSAISRAIADAAKAGEAVEVNTSRLSGPASIAGPVLTTNKADGTVETKTTTNNYAYSGDKVTYNTTTVTNIYNPVTNTTTTETATETPAKEPEKQTECEKNPDAVACAELDTPDGEIPRESHTITFAEESVFGSGSCPANLTANVGTLGKSVMVWNWTKTCELAYPLRFMVLLLATFAGFLIVMPGGART